MNNKFEHIHSETIIITPTVLEELEASKTSAIKRIMILVDSNIDNDSKLHGSLRKAVLDSLNDITRNFAGTLDNVIDKYKVTIESKDKKIEMMQSIINSFNKDSE